MMKKRVDGIAKPTRRQLLRAGLATGASGFGIGALGPAVTAQADDQWWRNVLDPTRRFSTTRDADREARSRTRQRATLDDLRKGPVPLRSDEMFDYLQTAIERYQQIAAQGGWPEVPGPRMMRPGEDDRRVPVLRRRLRASGDLGRARYNYEDYTFDGELEEAVKRFQMRHGLRARGRVDRPTFAALNISADLRLQQLRLNQQRIRELLRDRIEDRYVLVNVPGYQLEAVERFEVQQRHRVIVGRPGRETPSIKASIRALNFFPYWRVPQSVARSDLIPQLRRDPTYLEKEHIKAKLGSYDAEPLDPRTVDWTTADPSKILFRQDPGKWNALGLVRIDMPNKHIVYMHDTPMKQLFGRPARAYSAGCVRVHEVMKLADWIARKEAGWAEPGRADEIVEGGTALTVDLTRPVPVYFTYVTAWGEADGTVSFRPDIYDRDGSRVFAGDIDPDAPAVPLTLTP
ncbi:MAG: L,D-transpeptidase family protein [Pseudomonadota bacterium]